MLKPTIYLDTSFFSAYWYTGDDPDLNSRRKKTREWWDIERQHFELVTSAFAEAELRKGLYRRQSECIKMCRRMSYCVITRTTNFFREELIRKQIIPANKPIDAWHLALAATHQWDYLLTWNYSHLANLDVQTRLAMLCERFGLLTPWLASPETIPQVRFGRVVRRRNRDV